MAHDLAGIGIGGTDEGRFARFLFDVDGDDRHLRALGADVGSSGGVRLKGDEAVDILGLELAGAVECRRCVELGVAGDQLEAGRFSSLLHAGLKRIGERDAENELGESDCQAFGAAGLDRLKLGDLGRKGRGWCVQIDLRRGRHRACQPHGGGKEQADQPPRSDEVR